MCAVCEFFKMVPKFLHVLGTCQELLTTYLTCQHKFLIHVQSRERVPGKRGARDTFFHHEDAVDVDTSFQQCETRQRHHTRKQVRGGEKNSMSKGRPKSIEMWDIRKMLILFSNLNLTTSASINQN